MTDHNLMIREALKTGLARFEDFRDWASGVLRNHEKESDPDILKKIEEDAAVKFRELGELVESTRALIRDADATVSARFKNQSAAMLDAVASRIAICKRALDFGSTPPGGQ